jgi:hypothetical protein
MARYRIYQFNIAGHVTATRAVECTSDDEAIRASDHGMKTLRYRKSGSVADASRVPQSGRPGSALAG